MKKIVRGNDFSMRIPVMKIVDGERVAFPLPACTDLAVNVVSLTKRIPLECSIDASQDNVLIAKVDSDKVRTGTYALEVKGKIFGNNWRSNEYEQFRIVENNAVADTEFDGDVIEGEDSVEMDTAIVFLPPTAELTQLIKDAESLNDKMQSLNQELNESEAQREEAETGRVNAESAREKAEEDRKTAEGQRVVIEAQREDNERERMAKETAREKAEDARGAAEAERVKNEQARVTAETERTTVESARNDAETARNAAEKQRGTNETSRSTAEQARKKAETGRTTSETERAAAESARSKAESERETAEQSRVNAESERVEAEKTRVADMKTAKDECGTAAQKAETAAKSADAASAKAETATTGAERCNVTMEGSTISVTDRNGETNSIDVVDVDEKVTVIITSSVDDVSISGIKVNVFLNNGKTPQQYTTNSEGKVSFTVARGNYYEVAVPEYADAQPINPVGYTAVLASREVDLAYLPYDEETSEKVIVTVKKYVEGTGSVWVGKTVAVTYDKKKVDYTTDSNGQISVYIPVGKEYTVNTADEDGYYVKFGRNTRAYTAKVVQRQIQFNLYQFKTGIYCVDDNLNEYTIDEWTATGRDNDEVKAIKIADQNLMLARGTFMFRVSDLKNLSALVQKQWCQQNTLFESIASNGNSSSDPNYYNGEQSSFLVRQEGVERGLNTPAFDYAYEQTFEIGGQTLNGFLMSIGQEYVHIYNFVTIREMLRTLYGDTIAEAYYKFMNNNRRWTSSQNGASNAWSCTATASHNLKSTSYYVLPVYAC